MTGNSYFNISEIKLSITPLFSVQIMSYLGVSDILYSDVIYSLISEILKSESSVIVSSTEKPWAVLFTPVCIGLLYGIFLNKYMFQLRVVSRASSSISASL